MGRKREEAGSFRAQRSHPAGGWVLFLGWIPNAVLIRHALSTVRGGRREWWEAESARLLDFHPISFMAQGQHAAPTN